MHFSKALAPFAKRFVAGETAAEAVEVASRMNARGIRGIIDFLGEDVTSPVQASSAVEEYIRLLALINEKRVDSAVSVKASQMGLLISRELCLENLGKVLREAERLKLFVWMDMEGSALTQKTIEIFQALREGYVNMGLCVQAYLVRTGADVDELIRQPATGEARPAGRPVSLRLCKGAYKEPPDVAWSEKRSVDGNYRVVAQKLLQRVGHGVFPAFATHDPHLIDDLLKLVQESKIEPRQFEFQMLYGIQNQRLEALAREGFQTRVYIPYGTTWLPYFLRRLRERKENVYFLLKNVFRR